MTNLQYKNDFYAWGIRNSLLLSRKRFEEVDADNVATEIFKLAEKEKREFNIFLMMLVSRILKHNHDPSISGHGLAAEIYQWQMKCLSLLDKSPSLRKVVSAHFDEIHQRAVIHVSIELGINEGELNKEVITLNDCLDDELIGRLAKKR